MNYSFLLLFKKLLAIVWKSFWIVPLGADGTLTCKQLEAICDYSSLSIGDLFNPRVSKLT